MSGEWRRIWAAIDARVRFGVRPGLERMERLLERLGRPEQGLRCVQVAGTNGKGGTAYALARLIGEARGASCGLFLSPHLLHPSERIRLNGTPLEEVAVARAWAELEPLLDEIEPSYFETLTALALLAFRQADMEWAVLECGLGGRWDATSVVTPELSLLTSVGADHLAVLGPTLADVARDKAQVAPRGGLLLSAEGDPELARVVEAAAAARGARVQRVSPGVGLREEHHGDLTALYHEEANAGLLLPVATRGWRDAAGLALAALAQLDLPYGDAGPLLVALEAGDLPGRFQVLSRDPPRVLDVAHNPPALRRLAEELAARWPGRRFNALLAGMADKDLAGNLAALAPVLAGCRVLLAEGHQRAAGRADWERAAAAAGMPGPDFVTRAEVERLKAAVAAGVSRDPWAEQPLLVGGSFLAVAAWLGSEELPPGL